jgi:DNA-binding NarL/FixJ family response regulator
MLEGQARARGPQSRASSRSGEDRPTRAVVIHEHAVMRTGLRAILENEEDIHVLAEADSARAAIDDAGRLPPPDVFVMGVVRGHPGGPHAVREIRSRWPDTPVLLLAASADEDALLAGIHAGASGYLLDSVSPAALVRAVRTLALGQSYVDPEIAALLLQQIRIGDQGTAGERLSRLSAQEQQVLVLVADGRTNREIATQLGLSIATVKKRVSAILAKLDVRRRVEAAAYLQRRST